MSCNIACSLAWKQPWHEETAIFKHISCTSHLKAPRCRFATARDRRQDNVIHLQCLSFLLLFFYCIRVANVCTNVRIGLQKCESCVIHEERLLCRLRIQRALEKDPEVQTSSARNALQTLPLGNSRNATTHKLWLASYSLSLPSSIADPPKGKMVILDPRWHNCTIFMRHIYPSLCFAGQQLLDTAAGDSTGPENKDIVASPLQACSVTHESDSPRLQAGPPVKEVRLYNATV